MKQSTLVATASWRNLAWALALCASCSSDPAPDDAMTSEDSTAGGDGSGTAADTSPTDGSGGDAGCDGPATAPAPVSNDPRPSSCTGSTTWITAVQGKVTAPDGTPMGCVKAQMCLHTGKPDFQFACLRPVDTAQDGSFTIDVPDGNRCIASASLHIFAPQQPYSASFCPLQLGSRDGHRTISEPFQLFPVSGASSLPPLGDEEAAREVEFEGGLRVTVTPGRMESGDDTYPALAASAVDPTSAGLCFFTPDVAPTLLYAFAPEVLVQQPSFDFSVPNTTGAAAGATFGVYILGGLDTTLASGDKLPESTWGRAGTATVSADGTTITGTGANGLPYLSWFGLVAE